MKASDYIVSFLRNIGCTHVFGYPGGAVTHLIDSLYRCPGIRFVSTYHEQAAAFAAEGYARASGRIGVALATSGPGATNLITGIGSAYFDSIPCLYITGQVNTYEYKGDRKMRQRGFQETDIVSIVKPITKYAARISNACDIRREFEKAVHIAASGRMGPVLLDIPMDIQRAELTESELEGYAADAEPASGIPVDTVVRMMSRSTRPVLLAGGGVRLSGAAELLNRVAEKLRMPVVTSLMGRDAFDNASELFAGMIGSYGHRCANLTAANSDLVLALGSRLDTRQTGTLPRSFAREAKLIRVDIDADELENRLKPDELGIRADIKAFLAALDAHAGELGMDMHAWLGRVGEYKRQYPLFAETGYPDPNGIMRAVSECLGPRDIVCLDVGQNQMWAAQSLRVTGGQRMLTSGGMAPMGFALPCAAGAFFGGAPGRVVAISGDGGMQMNIQELELIRRNGIPIKIIVMNNRSLGMIRQFQEMYFEGRYVATVRDYSAPDFCAVARAYGIPAIRIAGQADMGEIRNALLREGPVLLEVALQGFTSVVPKLAVNRPIEEQEPMPERKEFLVNMIVEPFDANEYRAFIRAKFDGLKRKRAEGAPGEDLPVLNGLGEHCGWLRSITADYREALPGLAETLARWRNENPMLSAHPFTATAEGTERWLDEMVLNREDRLLFLIVGPAGEWIGHIGYSSFDFGEKSCEVDAAVRGEKHKAPGMMTYALRALLDWGIRELGLKAIRLRVFSDNARAIAFYERNGFVAERTTPVEGSEKTYTVMRYAGNGVRA